MSSKKSKSTKETTGSKSKGKTIKHKTLIAPDAWINELADAQINDNKWKCSVAIIEEASVHASVYIEHFNEFALSGNRLAVKAISKFEIIQTVMKNLPIYNPGKEITPFALLSSEIFQLVGPGFEKNIPTSHLAPLIKYIILSYKRTNSNVRDGLDKIKKEFNDYQQSLWQSSRAKSPTVKDERAGKTANKGVSGKTNKSKAFTKLRKRGEEWKDVVWVDDSPVDGPQLFITISGFYDPDLPLALIRLNIPLDAVIKSNIIKSKPTVKEKLSKMPIDLEELFLSLNKFKRRSSPFLRCSTTRRSDSIALKSHEQKIMYFWNEIDFLKNGATTAFLFKNVMFLEFIPSHSMFEHEIGSFQAEIYKQLSYFLYSTVDIYKNHLKYLSEVKLTNVSDTRTLQPTEIQEYNSVLNSIPQEVITVPVILDALITQVCTSEETVADSSISNDFDEGVSLPEILSDRTMKINERNGTLDSLFIRLKAYYDLGDLVAGPNKSILSFSKNKHSTNTTTVVQFFDDVKLKTFHLSEDMANRLNKTTYSLLQTAWKHVLNKYFQYSNMENNLLRLCNEIIKVEQSSGSNEMYFYIYILIVNNILNSIILDNCYVTVRTNTLKGCSASYEVGDLCEDCIIELSVEQTSIYSCIKNQLSSTSCGTSLRTSSSSVSDDIIASQLFYIEDMTSDIIVQRFQDVQYDFNRIETRYCPFTDQVVLVFHNLPKQNTYEENWLGILRTHVPIRDFVDYIVDEENDWLENINNEVPVLVKNNDSSGVGHSMSQTTCLKEKPVVSILFPEKCFISLRSLKYEALIKQQHLEKTQAKSKDTSVKAESSKTQGSSKYAAKTKGKRGLDKIKDTGENVSEHECKQNFRFHGFDLGETMRCQFSGFYRNKILDDDCKITLHKVQKLYGETNYTINVSICGHNLYYAYGSLKGKCTMPFHTVLSSGTILHFGPPTRDMPIHDELDLFPPNSLLSHSSESDSLSTQNASRQTTFLNSQTNGMIDRNYFHHTIDDIKFYDIPSIYSFKMSSPSGLKVEIVQDETLGLFHIKQTLLAKGSYIKALQKEEFRCYLKNGSILIYKTDGKIEVLGANGSICEILEINDDISDDRSEKYDNINIVLDTESNNKEIKIKVNKTLSIEKKIKYTAEELLKENKINSKDSANSSFRSPTHNVLGNLEITSHELTTSDGKRYFIYKSSYTRMEDLLVISSTDICENSINSERLDGVTTKHLSDGSLVVDFPDGSRITSFPFEAEEIFSEWSAEELNTWFANFSDFQSEIEEEYPSFVEQKSKSRSEILNIYEDSNNGKGNEQDGYSSRKVSQRPHSKLRLSGNHSFRTVLTSNYTNSCKYKKPSYSDDGFVVYNVSYLMEHPNYCSISYNAQDKEVEFGMPFSTNITLKNDGTYKALFEGASLTITDNDIYFSRVDDNDMVLRTVILKSLSSNTRGSIDFAVFSKHSESFPKNFESVHTKSLVREIILEREMKSGMVLYSVDCFCNEILVDFDLNLYDIRTSKQSSSITKEDFSCYVINRDLSGFRLIGDSEVSGYIESVKEAGGLISESIDVWKSLFTCSPLQLNESERWKMNFKKHGLENGCDRKLVSTYGRRESWIQPFVKKGLKSTDINQYEAFIVRLFHRIPTSSLTLNKLKTALDKFKEQTIHAMNIYTTLDVFKDSLDLQEILSNPGTLRQVIELIQFKEEKDNDIFRENTKNYLLKSLINQAVIRARQQRQINKERELKNALKMKNIPPYHLSCFGQVHSVLDEVIESTFSICKSSSSVNKVVEINTIIDAILSLVCETENKNTSCTGSTPSCLSSKSSTGVESIISEIFKKFGEVIEEKNVQERVSTIMNKPLIHMTTDDLEYLSKVLQSQPVNCPLLNNEDFIFQDILDARLALSHYFNTLRDMLQHFRGR